MLLPNGITGFYGHKEDKPPSVDGSRFKKLCYNAAISVGGKVLSFKEPYTEYPSNFYEAKLSYKNLNILLNAHYPFLSFATVVEYDRVIFIDEPQLTKAFNSWDYKVLNQEELNKSLRLIEKGGNIVLQNGNELNYAELTQIQYWKPTNYGEVIFNFWD